MKAPTWLALAVLTAALAGCGSNDPSSSAETMTVTGSVAVDNEHVVQSLNNGDPCIGARYPDVKPGSQVVATGPDGKTVAIGTLGTGKIGPGSIDYGDLGELKACIYPFTLENVPKGLGFYKIGIGSRGSVQFTETDMAAGPKLTLTG